VSLYYYLRPIVTMFFQEGRANDELPDLPWTLTTVLSVTLAATLYLGIFPEPILAGLKQKIEAQPNELPRVAPRQ